MWTRRDGVGSTTAGGMNSCRFLLCCKIRCTTGEISCIFQQHDVSFKMHHLFSVGSQLLSFKSLNDEPRDFPSMFTSPKRPAPLPALRVSTIRGRKRIGAELEVSHMHHSDVYQPTIDTLNPFKTSNPSTSLSLFQKFEANPPGQRCSSQLWHLL